MANIVGKLVGGTIRVVVNLATQGGVAPDGQPMQRRRREVGRAVSDIQENRNPGRSLGQSVNADWYGGEGDTVSVEAAAASELEMKAALDDGVTRENLNDDSAYDERGLAPCQRVHEEGRRSLFGRRGRER